MHPGRAKHALYRVPDMGGPWWLSQSKRVPLDTLDTPDLDPTSIETEPWRQTNQAIWWAFHRHLATQPTRETVTHRQSDKTNLKLGRPYRRDGSNLSACVHLASIYLMDILGQHWAVGVCCLCETGFIYSCCWPFRTSTRTQFPMVPVVFAFLDTTRGLRSTRQIAVSSQMQ